MGETQSKSEMGQAVTPKDPKMVSTKVKSLKEQGEAMAKAFSDRVEELSGECQKALDASNHDEHVAAMVAFRLDSFGELLEKTMSKFQGTSKAKEGADTSFTEILQGKQMIASVLERVEELEKSNTTLKQAYDDIKKKQERGLDTKMNELQTRMAHTEKLFARLQKDMLKVQKSSKATEGMDHVLATLKTVVIPGMKDELTALRTTTIPSVESKLKDLNLKSTRELSGLKQKLESMTTDISECCDESDKLKENVNNLQTLVIANASLGAQYKQLESEQQALKKQVLASNEKIDTASKLFAQKVLSLKKLQNILNASKSGVGPRQQLRHMYEDPLKQLQEVSVNVQNLGTDIARLKTPLVGFTAQPHGPIEINENTHLTNFFDVVSNKGGCFNPAEGDFVAPHDGLYCFCVKIDHFNKVNYRVCLMSKKSNQEALQRLDVPMFYDCPHSALCVLHLSANEHVFIEILMLDGSVKLDDSLTFSGWSLGYD